MPDFTLKTYELFLDALSKRGYAFQTYHDFLQQPKPRVIILRHDVDLRKQNSLEFAKIQHRRGLPGSYYFRMVPESYDETVIREMAAMGHEIGYHYETMDTSKGDIDKAFEEFCHHLETLRKVAPVHTVCMHGSPRSPFDNKAIWTKYDYRSLGILGEPYYDTDFNKVAYLTDTGRRWNGSGVSVRDKVDGRFNFNFRSTFDIIHQADQLPDQVMFTFHPQRWTNQPLEWLRELIMQNIKNQVKGFLIKKANAG